MTARFKNETFSGVLRDSDSGALFDDVKFERCSFDNVWISQTTDPSLRSIVRNVRLSSCHVGPGMSIGAAVLEDVVVDGLTSSQHIDVYGAAFHRVVLRGRIPGTTLIDFVPAFEKDEQRRATAAFVRTNAAFYDSISGFALDISRAIFTDAFEIRSTIPGRLIIRNPRTQFLVTRERAEDLKFQELDFGRTGWDICIGRMLQGNGDSVVLCLDERPRLTEHFARAVRLLQEHGLAEPDDAEAAV